MGFDHIQLSTVVAVAVDFDVDADVAVDVDVAGVVIVAFPVDSYDTDRKGCKKSLELKNYLPDIFADLFHMVICLRNALKLCDLGRFDIEICLFLYQTLSLQILGLLENGLC